jgi:hypothetical protein
MQGTNNTLHWKLIGSAYKEAAMQSLESRLNTFVIIFVYFKMHF